MISKELRFEGHSHDRLESAFNEFDAANPAVWDLFCRFTLEALDRGRYRIGARMVIERIRWEETVRTTGTKGYKIPNNTAPYYARKFMRAFPAHQGLFVTHQTLGDATYHSLLAGETQP